MKWISVEDELPTKEGRIITVINGKYFLGEALYCPNIFTYRESDNIVNYCLDNGSPWAYKGWKKPSHYKDVTHWMPLPQVSSD